MALSDGEYFEIWDLFNFIHFFFRWLPEKGYGFLRRDTGGPDVFVHLRDLTDGITSLEEGQTVEFDIKNSDKGDVAENVIVLNET